jgi:cholesterol oxidase
MTSASAASPGTAVEHFDAVIVGSGFGGSVMAARLAEAGWSVCVLERGKAYPPGSFARTPYEMARNAWDPSNGTYGLFDLWSFSGLSAIVSSGLGGGSLIYSNVMLRKPKEWFVEHEAMPGGGHEHWPITYDDLEEHYEAVERRLGVQRYPLRRSPYDQAGRATALIKAADALGLERKLPNLAVTFHNQGRDPVPGEPIPGENLHGRSRTTCWLVAECNIGCNSGSKNSLDYNYLTDADSHVGTQIRPLCEVGTIARDSRGFRVGYVQHPRHDGDTAEQVTVTASRLVLAAGTLGSTYLLLKNRAIFETVPAMLGQRVSTNGDYLGLVLKAKDRSQRSREPLLLRPDFGPAIIATAKVPRIEGSSGHRGAFIQDAGYPSLVSWMVGQALPAVAPRLVKLLAQRLAAPLTGKDHAEMSSALRTILGSGVLTASSGPLLGMGRDVPDGRFRLDGHDLLELDWSSRSSHPYFEQVDRVIKAMGDQMDASAVLSPLALNLLVTVHPLGGCAMSDSRGSGVVDTNGQVWDIPGLYVTDGSVMPGPVGSNPSLTIAAFANRTATHLIECDDPRAVRT